MRASLVGKMKGNTKIEVFALQSMQGEMLIKLVVLLSVILLGTLGAVLFTLRSAQPTVESPHAAAVPIKQLTHDRVSALHPAWSPDNRLIAFESNCEGAFQIYIMNADGSGQRALTSGSNENRRPVWTPDGESILYDSSDTIQQQIWSVRIADGSRKQLTHVDGSADFATLSPDGQQLVFYLYNDMMLNLWTSRADGSDARPLTRDFADARREQPTTSWHQATWSADSQRLVFTGPDGKSIWIMRRDGSEARAIIDDGETNHLPWFLLDGRLAFITEYVPPKYGAAWTNAWAVDLNTGERTILYEFMSMQEPVAWNTDLTELVFASPRNGNFDIYLIALSAPGGLDALRGTPVPRVEVQ